MRIDRAAKFGIVGTIGVTTVSLATFGLVRIVWSNRISGFEERAIATILLIVVAGLAVNLMFLFAVVGVFVDRKLEARGLASPEE